MPDWESALLARHRLGSSYLSSAQEWFDPLANAIASHHDGAARPILVAVNGSQGSGKTTLCDYLQSSLQAQHGKRALALSIDDFYLTFGERQRLAETVHPLCATRGVPGTHDIDLLKTTVTQLLDPARSSDVVIPSFDKATDDRKAAKELERWTGALDIVLLEGWCLGARPQEEDVLAPPINALEEQEDSDGIWRRWANRCLADDYLPLYGCVDFWVMLAAPDFDCVLAWRSEQEQKLRESVANDSITKALQSPEDLHRFVQHYERLTKECLARLPGRVSYLLSLDVQRNVRAASHRLLGGK